MISSLQDIVQNRTIPFGPQVLRLDAPAVADQIAHAIRQHVLRHLRRRGAVVGMSGGVDSSVVAALCVKALGPEHVLGLLMPEEDSDPQSLRLGRLMADILGVETVVEDIAPILRVSGCYQRRDQAICRVVPEYGRGYKCKIALASGNEMGGYNLYWLIVESPDGKRARIRLPLGPYLQIVAATNMKQRTRKQLEYYHADRLNYAVAGTPNRLEYDQGFFVKNGDGAADFKPIAHLYKTQVYQLAEALGVPGEIRRRPPTTDTYSLEQTQEEFYFALPYDKMDLCLYGLNHDIPPAEVAAATDLSEQQVQRVFRDIQAKRRTTGYQHTPPLMIEPVVQAGLTSRLDADT